MHNRSLLSALLFSTVSARAVVRRQDGPVDPGTAADCTYYETALTADDTCTTFEENWGISHADFVSWNPSVKDDCSGLQIGNSYCVEVNFGVPRPTSTTAPTTTSAASEPTGPAKPSPTQDGLIDTCTSFYLAVKGDTCDKIVKQYGTFTFAEFYAWNPAVGEDCAGLWASTYYCVGVPSTPTSKPSSTTSVPTATPTGPSPVQDGIVNTCTTFYKAVTGDTCSAIVTRYGTFSLADFTTWNPAVGEDCSGLWLGYYYCVGVPGTPTATPTTTQTSAKPTASGPSPTQEGIVLTCTNYYKAVSGDTCSKIANSYGTFSLDDFLSWNPAVGQDCSGLWLGYYYCVGVPGTPTTTSTTTANPPATTTTASGCAGAPSPTQPGAVCPCSKWHQVGSGNTCQSIEKQYGISAAEFNAWNPQVGSDCSTLWLGYYVCVGV